MSINTTSTSNIAYTDVRSAPPAEPILQPTSMPIDLPIFELPPPLGNSPNSVDSLLINTQPEQAREEIERVSTAVNGVLSFLKTKSGPDETKEDSPTGCG